MLFGPKCQVVLPVVLHGNKCNVTFHHNSYHDLLYPQAFGAVESMTDRLCIKSNGTKQFHFSAEDLMACCRECGNGWVCVCVCVRMCVYDCLSFAWLTSRLRCAQVVASVNAASCVPTLRAAPDDVTLTVTSDLPQVNHVLPSISMFLVSC